MNKKILITIDLYKVINKIIIIFHNKLFWKKNNNNNED